MSDFLARQSHETHGLLVAILLTFGLKAGAQMSLGDSITIASFVGAITTAGMKIKDGTE